MRKYHCQNGGRLSASVETRVIARYQYHVTGAVRDFKMAASAGKISKGGFLTAGNGDDQLLSMEKMRASPELWPEQIPGVSEFASVKSPSSNPGSPPKWLAELEKDDIDLLQEFGSLTAAQLMEKVRGLQNLAYQLGLEEAREMTRGKFLNILEKQNKYPVAKKE